MRFEDSKNPVKVYDAICGQGKTQRLIKELASVDNPVLYITPLLSETERVSGMILDEDGFPVYDDEGGTIYDLNHPLAHKQFLLPVGGSKLEHIKALFRDNRSICATHKLFSMLDQEALNLLKTKNYVLVIDEVLEVWKKFSLFESVEYDPRSSKGVDESEKGGSRISKDDKEILNLIDNGFIEVDPLGMLHWQDDKFQLNEDNLLYSKVKKACDLHQLFLSNGRVIYWELNKSLIGAFSQVYVATYMFNKSFMAKYLDIHNIQYEIEKFGNKPQDYKDLFNIAEGKINDVGDKFHFLSYTSQVSGKDKELIVNTLRKNLENYFRHVVEAPKENRLWTSFKPVKSKISNRRYSDSWLAYNTKATNDYINVTNVAYLCNNFPDSSLLTMVKVRQEGIEYESNMWALSEMLQFLFRTAVRRGQKINVYIPSSRMRGLLKDWLEGKFE